MTWSLEAKRKLSSLYKNIDKHLNKAAAAAKKKKKKNRKEKSEKKISKKKNKNLNKNRFFHPSMWEYPYCILNVSRATNVSSSFFCLWSLKQISESWTLKTCCCFFFRIFSCWKFLKVSFFSPSPPPPSSWLSTWFTVINCRKKSRRSSTTVLIISAKQKQEQLPNSWK